MHFVIVAGEASGDHLGGKLTEAILSQNNRIEFSGLGGPSMRAAGVTTLFDISETAVMGLFEVIKHYPRLKNILNTLKKHLADQKPDLLILIDYPEFNLKLAKTAKELRIPVLFYVSPQVWAWRKGRINQIKQCVDLMIVLFPFEVDFYREHGVAAYLAQHPIVSKTQLKLTTEKAIVPDQLTIGLLPGSRQSEIQRLLPVMLQAADRLHEQYPSSKFIVPVAPAINPSTLQSLIGSNRFAYIEVFEGELPEACARCDLAVVTSGTATLEVAILGIPMIIVYKMSSLTHMLLRPFLKIQCFGLANIILGEKFYTELLQGEVSAVNIYKVVNKLLQSKETMATSIERGHKLRELLHGGMNNLEVANQAILLANKAKSGSSS